MKPFLQVFSALPEDITAPFADCAVAGLVHDPESNTLTLTLNGTNGQDTEPLRAAIKTAYKVSDVVIIIVGDAPLCVPSKNHIVPPETPIPPAVPEISYEELKEQKLREAKEKLPQPSVNTVLYGAAFKPEPIPMRDISGDSEKVCVAGTVFAADSAETRSGYRLSFDMTDGTSSVRIKHFFSNRDGYGKKKKDLTAIKGIKPGMELAVKGGMVWDVFNDKEEQSLTPDAIIYHELSKTRVDNAPKKRVELHLHTNMSEMDGLTDVSKLMKRCAEWGYKAVAVTDHGVVHAFPDTMNARFKHIKDGEFKVLYGCEAYLVDDREKLRERGKQSQHITLLVKNAAGLRNLYELVSKAHLDGFYYHPTISRADLEKRREGLLVGSACEAGELFSAVVDWKPMEELKKIAEFYDYLEIMPICNNLFLIDKGAAKDEEGLRDFNRTILHVGAMTGIPVVATGDAHFLDPGDEIYRSVLLASKGMDTDRPLPLFFRTTEEMLEEFAYLGEEKAFEVVVTNTNLIADMCETVQPVMKGKFFPPRIEGAADELRRLSDERARELYGDPVPEHIAHRMKLELEPIISGGYEAIYIAARKLVAKSMEAGYPVGSRGSVGSSIIAFLSGITEVNALPPHYRCPSCKWNEFPENPEAACGVDMPKRNCPICGAETHRDGFDIPFATFLGFDADKQPDIDLNFSGEYQEKAHRQTFEMFGERNVYRAGTIATVANKTAVGFALKYTESKGIALPPAEINRLAKGCEGVRRTTGQHPGGMVVIPDGNNINEFTPVQYPANKRESGVITTHFDYHALEDNLIKLDILGHDDPTMLKHLADMTGVDPSSIDLGDPDTMSIFLSSKILGFENDDILGVTGACDVPEFGTRFVREMLVRTKPTTFDELVRISGLSHGTDVWLGNAADLVSKKVATLKEVICARDDITLYLSNMGIDRREAFTISESVRKGKGLKPEWEQNMIRHRIPQWYIDSCKKIKYMFPKAHAVAYVMSAFRIAWFKVNYPKEYYSAYFSIRSAVLDSKLMTLGAERIKAKLQEMFKQSNLTQGDEDKLTMLEVCYEFNTRGFEFEPIDLWESDAFKFKVTQKGLRLPFLAQPGLGEKAAADIVREREKAPFLSMDELSARCGALNKTHIETLKASGALGDLPESMQISMFG
ncbi:MAG: PolC-type DNA polymerase III [Oscillospiraceae bacterium]|nr:PolC-type DNA polymerase III [Oscillospiraceae bacterium]